MKLKHLSLQGYKTFATKTEFAFDDGITAVVGPNGSGKSNVADAVRWVLGEQSYSTLRGKRTIDMIFSGSKTRARAGMAQAILTLDNSDGWLPIDYTEVEICRRAYRSGENEYLLNGQKVRLMDINDLLARAGLAEQTYTIIGQGLIDQALSLKADERRALFEEAAGISHYKTKRATSLRRLQDTQRNLERIYDILSELRPRLNSLRRQAERAQNYTQLETDLHALLRTWYGYQWEASKTTLRQRRLLAEAAEERWTKGRAAFLIRQDQIEAMRSQLHDLEEEQQRLVNNRESVRESWEQARREVAILRERRSALERQLAETSEDLPLLLTQKESAAAELEGAAVELQSVQQSLDQQKISLAAFETGFEQKQQEIDQTRRVIEELELRFNQTRTRIAQAQGQLSQLEERRRERQPTAQETSELDSLAADIEKLALAAESAQTAASELQEQRRGLQDQRRNFEKTIGERRRELENERRLFNQTQTAVARLQTRAEMLDQLRQKEAPRIPGVELLGQLAQIVTIPPEWQKPLEMALQNRLATLIVPDEQTLWRLIEGRSAEQSLAAVALDRLPSATGERVSLASLPGAIALAVEIITTPPRFRPVAEALLGRIVLTQTGRDALNLAPNLPPGYTAVSADGVVTHASGLVELPRQDGRQSLLGQEEAWRQAAVALEQEKEKLAAIDQAVAGRNEGLRELLKQLEENNRERQRLGRLADETVQKVTQAQRELDRATQRQTFFQQQAAREQQEAVLSLERIESLKQTIASSEEELEIIKRESAAARETLDSLPVGEAQQQRQTLSQQIEAVRSIVESRRAITDSRRATLTQIDQQISRVQSRREEWSGQLLEMNLADEEAKLNGLQERMNEIKGELEPLRERMRRLQTDLRRQEGEAAAAQKSTHDLETRYTQTRVSLTQHETHIDNLKDRIRQDLGLVALTYAEEQTGDTPLPLSEVIEKLPVVDELPADLEETIQKLRGQLSRIGAVNPEAPAEFTEVQERHEFLSQQLEDLEETEKQLRQVIAELDELTSRAFAETVEKVNQVFSKMFTRLFGGGSAHLLLTEPDDLTITGVDIVAQLPGRRPQGLALLSGGERSLTALSLIFALLKVSPTPFCVMDEVDAILDEANVTRFREVLQELSEQTQFVVITHNQRDRAGGATVYGITMGTDSTSQLISVKPEEYVTQAELLQ